ncbi:LysR family transcriptional regulator [Burkholderia glumae]|uniref:LysR family transcriptional regulator n=1 Tax=Burkholderia glumae TaxID=337 RepID=A0AAP9XYB1_BURGL|nr:LysR family transcriptional regulator [Burkholderia glumae]ACR30674.1 Transcriptional regulator, LysR family [Burkholderia glumae BGR1]AJY62632.1 bacterial regulatory helix-turn-helix, lysR family protein [Burkholderia glumae LMG 2196 = ATCC 33617]KHJ59917.1 LysR family transcriptional regulator [Burkholderia glumae]MCM2484030.1 LysR family transcriptional regulator [Burkholderia glumae]MCM2509722.1 LysR family transcriptional regulator [Burkholderia glumae]
MELRQLRHFVAVAEEANFTRAAERCHIVQSALSTSIRLLEEELGARLLVRTTRRVSLSAAGAVFLDSARRALDILDRAGLEVADITSVRRGKLSIGTVQSLPQFLELPALLSRFYHAHPGVEVRLVQGGAAELNEKVDARELDLAILPIEERNERLASHVIACDEMVLACRRDHPLAASGQVPLSRLTKQAFVDFVPGQGTRRLVDRGFAEAGLQRRVAFEIGDLDTLLELVRQGLGVALLPEDIVVRRPDMLACVRLEQTQLCWELVVTHAASAAGDAPDPLDPAPVAFLDMLMAETAGQR